MRYRYVFFDFDGTVVNTLDALVATVNETLGIHGLNPIRYTEKGTSIKDVYSKFKHNVDPEKLRSTHLVVQQKHYLKNILFPGAIEVFQELTKAGCILAIITTANKNKIKHLMNYMGIDKFFSAVVTESDVENRKPHSEPFEKAFKLLGLSDINKNSTIMVGDSEVDIVGASRFGIDSVGVLYGPFGQDIREYNPTYIITDLRELISIIDLSYEQ